MRCVECGLFAPSCRLERCLGSPIIFLAEALARSALCSAGRSGGRAVESERIACIYYPAALGNVRRQNRHSIGSCENLLGLREFMPYFSRADD
jgi:hypothetical protein